ncbi:uncharacterized protein LOC62_01G000513 [Vanrija pseudolonga]|uniref:GH18 domain-containing protein n=1 Tax=Vanrija pseudolonga TaxID=143232 RepID=A0AAF0XZK8_9TREE|nr:hypothetical protein LOC62_01G000513 [Vanrija pseudolonga]
MLLSLLLLPFVTATLAPLDGRSLSDCVPGSMRCNGTVLSHTVFANDVPPSVAELGGYNRLILSFYESSGYQDSQNVVNWVAMSASDRQTLLDSYHAAGVALMLAVFGGTDKPTTNGLDPTSFATKVAAFVKQYGFDGIDIDYEDFDAFEGGTGVPWINTPIAPWFSTSMYKDGGYTAVYKAVGDSLNWFNLQFYNQNNYYTSCDQLVKDSTATGYPGTSLAQLQSMSGVPYDKLVLGKPIDKAAADGGYMTPSALGTCVAQAKQMGWNGGVMFWEWIPKDVSGSQETVKSLTGRIRPIFSRR